MVSDQLPICMLHVEMMPFRMDVGQKVFRNRAKFDAKHMSFCSRGFDLTKKKVAHPFSFHGSPLDASLIRPEETWMLHELWP